MFTRRLLGSLSLVALTCLAPLLSAVPVGAQLQAAIMPPSRVQEPLRLRRFTGDGSGSIQVISKDGKRLECPLKHTSVQASISGYMARVTVKQLFGNPFKDKIEATYTFPLTDTGAVDDMLMRVGTRTIYGTIKKREEAREIYDKARREGHVAALLDQERPNIFTQSVANIEPGKEIEVTLTYVDLLPYENGNYSFSFPTVVGPRFNPGQPAGRTGKGFSPDTTSVADGSKITPHVAPDGVRAGHDISINVSIDAGVPINSIQSQLHEITLKRDGANAANVSLKDKDAIPNKDFVLTWGVAADQVRSGYLTNGKDGNGFFTLMIMPPKRPTVSELQPKEMVFLIDCSGSQSGAPLQKCKEAMEYSLDHMNPHDTFQVIAFNSSVTRLFDRPREANADMRKVAKEFVNSLQANGGTWMAPAVEAVCSQPADAHRLRIVSFMTDGYVGNDMEIVGMVKKLRDKSRWFPFGTGNSVNRFLIDNVAKMGGGEPDYVYLNSNAAEVGKKFYDKISSPVLTDLKVDFEGLQVKEVFPSELSDVWAQHPLYITGRYVKPGAGTVTLTGFSGGKPYKQSLKVEFPQNNPKNEVLGSIWARAKVDRLMDQDWIGAQRGELNKELKDEIVRTALDHHLMTQYTSFVAVEEKTVTKGGVAQTVEVPVEMPDGVSRQGVFGDEKAEMSKQPMAGAFGGASSLQGGMYAARRKSAAGRSLNMPAQINAPLAQAVAPSCPPPPLPFGKPSSSAKFGSPGNALKGATNGTIGSGSAAARGETPADNPAAYAAAKKKLSKKLQDLLAKSVTQTVKIKVHVKDANAVTWQLASFMKIDATIYSDKVVLGEADARQLLSIAADANVTSIELDE